MPKLYVGSHLNKDKTFLNTIQKGLENIQTEAIQMFYKSPQGKSTEIKTTDEETIKIKKYLQDTDTMFVCHASYTLNFAKEITSQTYYIMESLEEDLRVANNMGAIGVVIHMGKQLKLEYQEALNLFVENIKDIIKIIKRHKWQSKIIFENSAHQGTEMCYTVEQLGEMFNMFTDTEKEHIGFCIDTCHMFAACYDIRKSEVCEDFFTIWKKYIGMKYIMCIHLNDSKKDNCSKVDRHENLGKGFIGDKGLKQFLLCLMDRLPKQAKIPIILETPDHENHQLEIKKVRKWIM